MKAGPELDKLIAEKVMKWKFSQSSFEQYEPSYWADDSGKKVWTRHFSPSTDAAAAWKAVEKLTELKVWGSFRIKYCSIFKRWNVGWEWRDHGSSGVEFESVSESAPHAICLAALKVFKDA
jgi:hypothetical protein